MTPSFLGEFAAQLAALSGEKELAAAVREARAQHRARWTPQTSGRTWMHEHAALLDSAVRRLFALAQERTRTEGNEPASVAIVATGGYGQKLLAPFSDLDLTFLTDRDDNSPFLHTLFKLTMDVLLSGAKIKIGYAYRTLRELSEPGGVSVLDHQTQTALLDARLVAGDANLLVSFDQLVQTSLHVAEFLFFKEAERVAVRTRTAAGTGGENLSPVSPFVASPNVKEGPGGLRDLQTAAWMARVRWNQKGDNLWRDLVHRKVITKADLKSLSQSRDFLLNVRCALHIESGERRDLLTPPRQEAVARRLLFDDLPDPSGAFVRPGVEAFMERYYEAAYHLDRLWIKIKTRCLDAPLPLGPLAPGLSCVKGRVMITDPEQAGQNPLWPMHALQFCQTHTLELAPAAREAIEAFRTGASWHTDETRLAAGQQFVSLLILPGDAGQTVRSMEETGLLHDLLPDLAACMGLVPYDPSHTSTVGEHSIRVLENLLRLRDVDSNKTSENAPFFAALREIDNPAPLFLAALLHDVGKKRPVTKAGVPAHHAETGAEIIPAACARLGCEGHVTDAVVFLVKNHLKLAEVSRLRDLSLSRTIKEVADLTGDPLRLRMLYLLTWADTQAVGPGVWSERSARLLTELFERTDAHFASVSASTDAPSHDDEAGRLNSVRERLQRKLSAPSVKLEGSGKAVGSEGEWDDLPPETVHAHIEAMPAAYLLGTPPDTIALHLRLIDQWRNQNASIHEPFDLPVLDMRVVPPDTDQTALVVVTGDDPAPGLLAKITGVLLACEVRLHAAQVWTRPVPDHNENKEEGERRVALDTLFVDFHDRPLGPVLRRTVANALHDVLTGQVAVADLLERKRKSVESGLPLLRVMQADDQISPDYTLLDVEAPDDRGTLYRFALVFSHWRWNIHAARVSRWGGKARYAFYLTGQDGGPVSVAEVRAHFAGAGETSSSI